MLGLFRRQRRLFGGESAAEGEVHKNCGIRPHSPVAEPLTAAGTRSLSPMDQ